MTDEDVGEPFFFERNDRVKIHDFKIFGPKPNEETHETVSDVIGSRGPIIVSDTSFTYGPARRMELTVEVRDHLRD